VAFEAVGVFWDCRQASGSANTEQDTKHQAPQANTKHPTPNSK
jgi:hypothetical protein